MMKVIRFEIEGFLNSFRIPFFRTYHKTFLAPPKTTIIGLLCNISLKSQKEFFEILDKELIDISIVIDTIEGKAKDLWSYKTLKKDKIRGKSVIRRDKLYLPRYIVYLKIEEKVLYNEILSSLKKPQNIPSLGLDDELVVIKNITEIELGKNTTNRINSVFLDKNLPPYKAFVKDITEIIELPVSNLTPIKFVAFDKKGKRISKESILEFHQVEYRNCQIEFQDNIKTFTDAELGNGVIFY